MLNETKQNQIVKVINYLHIQIFNKLVIEILVIIAVVVVVTAQYHEILVIDF